MLDAFHILADSDDNIGKIVVGVIIFVIWGIGALANMAKKQGRVSPQAQAEMERAMREQIAAAHRQDAAHALQQMNLMPPPLPPTASMRSGEQRHGPVVPPMRNLAQMPMPPRVPQQQHRPVVSRPQPQVQVPSQPTQRKSKQRRAPAVVVPTASRGSFPQDTPGVQESQIGYGVTPASPARRQAAHAMTDASVLRLTPATLRQNFILTEIFQPPLALREQS